MIRLKGVVGEMASMLAVCFMILACFGANKLVAFGILIEEEGQDVACKNLPPCEFKGENGDICGNANDIGNSGGGVCDPGQIECVCQLTTLMECVCSK